MHDYLWKVTLTLLGWSDKHGHVFTTRLRAACGNHYNHMQACQISHKHYDNTGKPKTSTPALRGYAPLYTPLDKRSSPLSPALLSLVWLITASTLSQELGSFKYKEGEYNTVGLTVLPPRSSVWSNESNCGSGSPRGWASCLLEMLGAFLSDALSAEAGLYLWSLCQGEYSDRAELVKKLLLNPTPWG